MKNKIFMMQKRRIIYINKYLLISNSADRLIFANNLEQPHISKDRISRKRRKPRMEKL